MLRSPLNAKGVTKHTIMGNGYANVVETRKYICLCVSGVDQKREIFRTTYGGDCRDDDSRRP